jgi:hypothetical protein
MGGIFSFQTTDDLPMTPKPLEHPDRMTAAARAAEITTILAQAIVRTIQKNQLPENSFRLGFPPHQSVHTTPYKAEKTS